LHNVPNPDNSDFGYQDFISNIDALVMGRVTFETVCAFDCPWPYQIPVFVLSNSLKTLPEEYKDKVELVNGSLSDILAQINSKGYKRLYIDGGKTIQSFLKEDLIDELVLTTIPVLLGGGVSLFGDLPISQKYKHIKTSILVNKIVQSEYHRDR